MGAGFVGGCCVSGWVGEASGWAGAPVPCADVGAAPKGCVAAFGATGAGAVMGWEAARRVRSVTQRPIALLASVEPASEMSHGRSLP